MQKIIYLFIITFFFASSCKKDIASNIPDCIKKEIKDNKKNKNWAIGTVEEYSFQGKLVYTFNPDGRIIADGSTAIKNENCIVICNVGGFGGPGVDSCKSDNFFQVAIFIRTIWKK